MMYRGLCLILLLFISAPGCGSNEAAGPKLLPVTGTVRLDGQPLPGADVVFIPAEKTPGLGGSARTDETGRFALNYARGGEGAPAGDYRVTVSRRLLPDGSPVPAGDTTSPIESPARETLPAIYSSSAQTTLKASVQPDGEPIELNLGDASGAAADE